jgi:beta-N-acetylhexosaminidase
MTIPSPPVANELGQLFMAGLPGPELDDSTRALVAEEGVNHFILFRRNVKDPAQLAALCRDLRDLCTASELAAPLIAIDQEGGSVTRLPPPFTQFGHARDLAQGADPVAALTAYARTCARELIEMGINMNLAPVLDVCPGGQGLFMEKRSLGSDPLVVAELGQLVITEMQAHGVAACGKHFPGLGAAGQDPHQLLPTVASTIAALREIDLVPFRAAIAAGIAALMTSHTLYPALDKENPATLSTLILANLIRGEIGFDGLLITDDLEMGAIENRWSVAEASLAALLAGADLLLICHDHDKVRASLEILRQAYADGRLSNVRLQRSLRRIMTVQDRFAAG